MTAIQLTRSPETCILLRRHSARLPHCTHCRYFCDGTTGRDPIPYVLSVGTELVLRIRKWRVVSELSTADNAGFGRPYVVEDEEGNEAVAKLVDKDPGADRELLIGAANQAARYRNVLPVLDDGEHNDQWVLVMPRAETSLKKYLEGRGGVLDVGEAISVLIDVATALNDLKGVLVHRDLKPANVLRFNGAWMIADFGLARYAEASTATDTWKHNATWLYASPEQWRGQHATEAADVYSFGVMAYELLAGSRPFSGPDLREQHLNQKAPALTVGPLRLQDLIADCLLKAPEGRPTPAMILSRLTTVVDEVPTGAGLDILAQANRKSIQAKAEVDAQKSAELEEEERRATLIAAAVQQFQRVGDTLLEALRTHATAATLTTDPNKRRIPRASDSAANGRVFVANLDGARLGLDKPRASTDRHGQLPFSVVAESVIRVTRADPLRDWIGRSHSLWYCDVDEQGVFGWYEVAFSSMNFGGGGLRELEPFDLTAGQAREPLSMVLGMMQVAWDFRALDLSDLSEFVDRWLGWFGQAATGQLQRPMMMPERPLTGSRWWRR
ncbi:serine/threonine-protein kinase [Mycolicibacterium sp. XJ662]